MSNQSVFCMFPGQGSQKVGMGLDLNNSYSAVKEIFARADNALGFSLSKLCFEGPDTQLTLTHIAQPAILTVSVAAFELAMSAKKDGFTPTVAAGHSLGEYSALVAAKSLTFEDAVKLVNQRGSFMQEAVPVGVGKMVAVLGKEVSEIEDALAKVTTGVAEIANINAPGQIVVAGSKDGVDQFVSFLPGTRVMELTVSAPFHCSLMKPAELKLREALSKIEIKPPQFPVIQNVTAEASSDPEVIRENLIKQVCGRVRWVECVEKAVTHYGVQKACEFGSGAVLAGLLKRINPLLERESLGTAEQFAAAA